MRSARLWLVGLAAGVGSMMLAGPALAQPRSERAAERAAAQEYRDVRSNYEALPPVVKESLDRERAGRRVETVYLAERPSRSWWSVVVLTRHGDRIIRLSPRGYVLSVVEMTPEQVTAYRAAPDEWFKQYLHDQSAREEATYRDLDKVTATPAHPERIAWDGMPARVRATFLRESGGIKPDYIVRYRDKEGVIFQANLPEGHGTVHMLQVLPDGAVYNESDFTNGGKAIAGDWRPKTVLLEEVPRPVRAAIDHAAPRANVVHVDMVTRGGHDIYTVEIDKPNEARYLVIGGDGHVISDMSDHY